VLANKKFIIGGPILLLTLAFLGYMAFSESVPYYYTVSELLSQRNSTDLANVRVSGVVSPGTLETSTSKITFTLTDGDNELEVDYQGVTPQTFQEGREIIVEGTYHQSGTFEASKILTKCPSKYTQDSGAK